MKRVGIFINFSASLHFRFRFLIVIMVVALLYPVVVSADDTNSGAADRAYTISVLRRIADPVFIPLSENRLHSVIPRKNWETRESDIHTSPLQAFGRTLSGMAPWLALGADDTDEGKLRARYIELARRCLINATDPRLPDYMFKKLTQEDVVHAAYLAYPLLIAPKQLWEPLTPAQRQNIIAALKTHRAFQPSENNWVLFSATIECAIWELTGDCNKAPIEYAIHRFMSEWYLGDGTYGDGKNFHWDYYNSYVIHPLLLETLRVCRDKGDPLGALLPQEQQRADRYAEVLEHLISPEGTFPVIGRSSVYRFAVFQEIGYMGFRWGWPSSLDPGATRAAMTTVIRRMIEASGTFDKNGWLNIGVVGYQPSARDPYNYTGALYFCTVGLSHLGIPADAPFWTAPAGKWFQQRVWSGEDIPNQHFVNY